MDPNKGAGINAVPRFYLASSEPAGAVNACACGQFLKKGERTLAVARKDRLDLYGFDAEGMKIVATTRMANSISSIHPVCPSWSKCDLLFVLLNDKNVHMLEFSYDYGGRPSISSRAFGSALDRVGRLSELGPFVSVDPQFRCIALHIYESLIRIVPLIHEPTDPRELESFNVRIDENQLKSITFLHNAADHPSLAILYRDPTGSHVVTYEVDFREKDLKPLTVPRLEMRNIETESTALVAVPGTNRGVLACGIEILTYMDGEAGSSLTAHVKKASRGVGCAYTVLSDTPGTTKILVGDMKGNFHIVLLKKTAKSDGKFSRVTELGMMGLGRLVIASCAAYLDNKVIFIGSRTGDSQIIRFRDDINQETGNLFDVLEPIQNLGAIGDFTLIRSDPGSPPQMIVCSGYGPGSSARIIRSGIGVQDITSLELPTARQIFAINSTSVNETTQDMLVLSFLSETRILKIEQEIGDFDDLRPESVGAFVLDQPTFLVAKINGLIVQVTQTSIRLIQPGNLTLQHEFQPENASYKIGSAAFCGNYLIAGAFDTLLVVDLTVPTNPFKREIKMDGQISAVDIYSFASATPTLHIAVATWRMDLRILSAPEWKVVVKVDLESNFFARSVMLHSLDNVDYIIAGLGDGSLQYLVFDKNTGAVGQAKRVNVGTQPTTLQAFSARGMPSIFICNDRPSVLHSSGGKLIFANVNMKNIYAVCQLNTPQYANSLAIITDNGMIIGRMDEIQKLHIRGVTLPGAPRRIAHQPETNTFGFLTMDDPGSRDVGGSGDGPDMEDAMEEEDPVRSLTELPSFKLVITDDTKYNILATFQLNVNEVTKSIVSGRLGKDPRTFYIIGTGLCKSDEKDSSQGRVIVFEYLAKEKRLNIVAEKQMKGFATELTIFKDKLLLLSGPSVKLMGWNEDNDLVPESHLSRFIMPVSMKVSGDFVIVADMMRSLNVLAYRADENKFEVIGEEPYPVWPSTCEFVDDDVYIMTTSSGNISFLRREVEATSGNIKQLNEVACINLSDMVNVVRKGTLLPDSALGERQFTKGALILATVSGAILHVLTINEEVYQILNQLVEKLCKSLMPFNRISAEKYNAVLDGNGSFKKPAYGVINGDLVELLTGMNADEIRETIAGIKDSSGVQVTVENVSRIVEDLSRSH